MKSRRTFIKATERSAALASMGVVSFAVHAADTIKVGALQSLSGTMAISETALKGTVLMTVPDDHRRYQVAGRPPGLVELLHVAEESGMSRRCNSATARILVIDRRGLRPPFLLTLWLWRYKLNNFGMKTTSQPSSSGTNISRNCMPFTTAMATDAKASG